MTTERPPTIDSQAAQRWDRLRLLPSPWLHEEVARRMEERLQWIKRQPQAWVHWEPVRGGLQAHGLLTRRYPKASCFVVESPVSIGPSASDLIANPWWSPRRWTGRPTHRGMPKAPGADMLWANMALHMAADPQALIGQWHDALAVDGFVMFSCLGPDTLREIRGLYQSLGWPQPSHTFTDMHDWGDMLVNAGFAEPVMDMERITLGFATPARLLEELRGLGRNLHPARFAGLRGKAWRQQLMHALGTYAADPDQPGQLKITFEVIYGHALKARPRLKVAPETTMSLQDMKAALAQGKKAALRAE